MRPSEAAFDFGLRHGSFLADREDFAIASLNVFVDFLVEDEIFLLFPVLRIFEPAAGDRSRLRFLGCDFDVKFGSSTSLVDLVTCGVDCSVSVGGSGASATTAVFSMTGRVLVSVLEEADDIFKGWSFSGLTGNALRDGSTKGEAIGRLLTEVGVTGIEALGC